jgi:uncharacterized BrkB/YihY/UPF0761 family membrane protein
MDEGLSTTDGLKPRPNRARAARKLALVICIVAAVLTLLIGFVSAKTVNGLVNHLTLGLLVALIVIVNLVSVLLCLIFFAAYRWIKRDLDPDAED